MWIHYYNIWHSNIFVQLTFTPYICWNSQSVPRISWSIYQYDILFCHESHHAAACTAFACTCTCTRTQLQIIYTNIIYQCRPFDFLYESWRNLIDRDGVEYYRVFGISLYLEQPLFPISTIQMALCPAAWTIHYRINFRVGPNNLSFWDVRYHKVNACEYTKICISLAAYVINMLNLLSDNPETSIHLLFFSFLYDLICGFFLFKCSHLWQIKLYIFDFFIMFVWSLIFDIYWWFGSSLAIHEIDNKHARIILATVSKSAFETERDISWL